MDYNNKRKALDDYFPKTRQNIKYNIYLIKTTFIITNMLTVYHIKKI